MKVHSVGGVRSMSPSELAWCMVWAFLLKPAHATSAEELLLRVQAAPVSGNVTLRCFIQENTAAMLYWYKQTLGHKPKKVSTLSMYTRKLALFNDFGNNPRIKLDPNNTLTIFDLQMTDSATYFCGYSNLKEFNFTDGVVVQVTDSGPSFQALVHQSEIVEPGSSLTLNCTVRASICDGEHSVYWFRQAEGSRSGVIYAQGGGSGRCAKNASTQTHTCDYNLPLDALGEPQNGTYYCALATCGRVVFGNGTKLDFQREAILDYGHPAIVALMASNCFFGLATLLLVLALCKSRRKDPPAVLATSDEYTLVQQTTIASPPRMPSPRPRGNPIPLHNNSDSGGVVYSHIWH